MNKAFMREPDLEGRAYCPRCGTIGLPLSGRTIEHHAGGEARSRMGDAAWFCDFPRCEVVYFNLLELVITTEQLRGPIYPKDPAAPLCPCFGFYWDDVEADAREDQPLRIRELLRKSQSADARCEVAAASGRCCMPEVQRLYMRLRNG